MEERRVIILGSVARKGLFEKLTFELRLEGGEKISHLDIWEGRVIQGTSTKTPRQEYIWYV